MCMHVMKFDWIADGLYENRTKLRYYVIVSSRRYCSKSSHRCHDDWFIDVKVLECNVTYILV